MRRTIKMTESELNRLISESVRRILNEEGENEVPASGNPDLGETGEDEYDFMQRYNRGEYGDPSFTGTETEINPQELQANVQELNSELDQDEDNDGWFNN